MGVRGSLLLFQKYFAKKVVGTNMPKYILKIFRTKSWGGDWIFSRRLVLVDAKIE
jgi:hypothetical protein